MLKGLAIVTMCLIFTRGMSGQPNEAPGNKQAIPDQFHPPSASIDSHNTYNSTQQACANAEDEPPHWYTPFKRPEWWLLMAAFLTLWVIGRQTHFTRLAAEATKEAAKAALVQANHLVASERAWIMADLRFEDGNGLSWGSEGDTQHTMAGVILSVKNSGSTPAWVYEQFIHLDVSPEVITSLGTYPSPNFPFIG